MPIRVNDALPLSGPERADLIDPIRAADPIAFAEQVSTGPGRFEHEPDRELCHALECYADGGSADQYASKPGQGGLARVGRVVHSTDRYGFQSVLIFPTQAAASEFCSELDAAATQQPIP